MAAGAEAVAHVVEAVPDVDALFCGGGLLAAGAFFECQKRGWSMPGRIAIASFDDIEMLRHLSPMVTTLRLPRHDIGVRSAQMLLCRILRSEGGGVGQGGVWPVSSRGWPYN